MDYAGCFVLIRNRCKVLANSFVDFLKSSMKSK